MHLAAKGGQQQAWSALHYGENVKEVNKKLPTVNDHMGECHSKLQALRKNIERIRSEIQSVLAAILTLHLSHEQQPLRQASLTQKFLDDAQFTGIHRHS